MGADMMSFILPTVRGEINIEHGVARMRHVVDQETDADTLLAVFQYATIEFDGDESTIMDEFAKPEFHARVLDAVEAHYRKEFTGLVESFTNADVDQCRFGDLILYMTGGESWGDLPTDTFGLWNELFGDNDLEYGNPYGDEAWFALGFGDFDFKFTVTEDSERPSGRFVTGTVSPLEL